ncbi:methyltransferase domain-containing protein, partial [Candidatus Uhrbacteria bacterium]|nr:methyltransferase domain-containing protein [Candidatus Uhrbacteria bacterium]
GMAYAVDIQKSALAGTAGRAKLDGASHITYIWSDIERVGATNIPAASLDVAMIVNTLYLTTHPDQAMIEAARLTKPHGRVLVVEWNPETTAVGPEAERRMTPDAVRAAASAAHLTEESMFAAGAYHQGFVFVRTE